jgi:hypothetical protein
MKKQPDRRRRSIFIGVDRRRQDDDYADRLIGGVHPFRQRSEAEDRRRGPSDRRKT